MTSAQKINLPSSVDSWIGRAEGVTSGLEDPVAGLLPTDALIDFCQAKYGLEIATVFLSPPPMGGDIWGLRPIDEARLAIFCADVCGHGPEVAPAARFLHSLILAASHAFDKPDEMLAQLNKYLHLMLPRGQFAAIFYAVIDIDNNELTYACSTFMPQLWRGELGAPFECLDGEGLPLGFLDNSQYEVYRRDFAPGAGLVLYSDAVVETPLPPCSIFTPDSLCSFVNGHAMEKTADTINKAIIERLDLSVKALADDLTLITLLRRTN